MQPDPVPRSRILRGLFNASLAAGKESLAAVKASLAMMTPLMRLSVDFLGINTAGETLNAMPQKSCFPVI